MRRLGALMVALFLAVLPGLAGAEIGCVCADAPTPCSCFIQLGDEGIAVLGIRAKLIEQGYLPAEYDTTFFDEQMQQAVVQLQAAFSLPQTGVMDDDTLTCLLWGMTAAELDIVQPSSNRTVVWIPTDGGTRLHNCKTCSGMYDPRLITARNGYELGMQHCRKRGCQ